MVGVLRANIRCTISNPASTDLARSSRSLTLGKVSRWLRYVALGDSITEESCDPGWADLLARILDGNARLQSSSLEFTNLGELDPRARSVVERRVPHAVALGADLVSMVIGGGDLLAARADPDALAAEVEGGVAALRASGADVLLATCFDPPYAFFRSSLRGRVATYNANLWSIARTHGAFTLDLWGARDLQAVRMWAENRQHLTPDGHRLLASKAAHSLGVPYFEVTPRR